MGKYFIQYDPVTPPKLTKRLWQTTSPRIQTFFRSSLLYTQMFFGVEISDDRKYVCVRRLMAGLKQTKKKQKDIKTGVKGWSFIGCEGRGHFAGGHFQISERYVWFILINFMKIVQSSNELDLKLNVKAVNSKHRTYKHDYE